MAIGHWICRHGYEHNGSHKDFPLVGWDEDFLNVYRQQDTSRAFEQAESSKKREKNYQMNCVGEIRSKMSIVKKYGIFHCK